MFEFKLSYNKTETKNVKVAKMGEFIKTCDILSQVYFWPFYQLHTPPLFLLGKVDFKKILWEMGNFLLPGVVMI